MRKQRKRPKELAKHSYKYIHQFAEQPVSAQHELQGVLKIEDLNFKELTI